VRVGDGQVVQAQRVAVGAQFRTAALAVQVDALRLAGPGRCFVVQGGQLVRGGFRLRTSAPPRPSRTRQGLPESRRIRVKTCGIPAEAGIHLIT
jgi:hypothetical protein